MNYNDYKKQVDILSLEEMEEIWTDLLQSLDLKNEDCKELFDDFINSVVSYSCERLKWNAVYDREERIEKDKGRTIIHDGLITRLNILARFLKNELNKDTSWRDRLGDEAHRKRIGDFACYVAFCYRINAR